MKKRVPRKLKKTIKNSKVIYDVSSTPEFFTMDDIIDIYNDFGWLFYDGRNKNSNRPQIINNKQMKLRVVDSNEWERFEKEGVVKFIRK